MAAAALASTLPGDRVDPGHVGYRGHHRHVAGAHVLARVACGHRRHHQLGHAHRQRLHGLCGDRRVARAAGSQHPVDPVLLMQPSRECRGGAGHRGHRRAAIACLGQRGQIGPSGRRQLLAAYVGLDRRRVERAGVGQQHVHTRFLQPVTQERVFVPLGVKGADQQDGGAHDARSAQSARRPRGSPAARAAPSRRLPGCRARAGAAAASRC